MPRADISMTAAEVDAFLDGCGQMVVGLLDADGWPTGTLAAVSRRSDQLTDGLAVQLADADPLRAAIGPGTQVVCLADEHATYSTIRGVIVHGRAGADDGAAVTVDVERVISFDFGRIPPG